MDVESIIKSILRNFLVLALTILIANFLSRSVWDLYNLYFRIGGGSWLDLSGIVGLIFGYVFFTPLFLGLFGDKNWLYWIGLFWTPIALFEIYIGKYQLLFSVGLVVISFVLGWFLRKLKEKFWDKRMKQKTA